MPVLSREEFDAIEFDAAASGDHQTAARRMSKLAVIGTQTDAMPRSEAFLRAGEQWLLADDPAAAASGFRLAMADGGPVFVDPRVPLARALFLLGKMAEAQTLLDNLKAEGRRDPRMCDLVAELLVERSDLAEALDWATAGVELCLARRTADGPQVTADRTGATTGGIQAPANGTQRAADGTEATVAHTNGAADASDSEAELRLLLSLRYRIRNDLGLPEDSYDALLDEA
ncbi:MAG TPA: hypothetical protein VMF87_35375 [Streptosporangiaceae bacterium]|nr:hypothetical protein [Streptosporangiaceae bacterium]